MADRNIETGPASLVVKTAKNNGCIDSDVTTLMNHFSSAKLSSPPIVQINGNNGEKSETDEPLEVDIVSPLRNFHLQRPAAKKKKASGWSSKTRQKEGRCGKPSRELNLSVVAGSIHRPVVWPARLRGPGLLLHDASSSGPASISKHTLLHPARLSSVPLLTKCSSSSRSSNGCGGKSDPAAASAALPSTAEAVLNKKIVKMLQKNTALDLNCGDSSAATLRLPANDKGAQRVFGVSEMERSATGKETDSFFSLSACFAEKEKYETGDTNVATYDFSSRGLGFRSPSSSQAYKSFTALPSSSHLSQEKDTCSSNSTPAPTSHSTSSVVSGEENRLPHSCSHEMRLEETNVNELASYFDDLLHIPRKMSSMAEMMYA